MKATCWLILGSLLFAGAAGAADWPAWRGPTGQGACDDKDLPLTWDAKKNENIVWKMPLPGADAKAGMDKNQSSPVVVRAKVFVTMSYWPGGAADPKAFPEHHVAC